MNDAIRDGRTFPAPHEFMGHAHRERPARPEDIVAYARAASTSGSERIRLREYGSTTGGWPLIELVVSSSANLERLATIENELARLGNQVGDEAVATEALQALPAVVWIGCGIHGDEISGPDAALELLHRLLTDQSPATSEWLDRLIVHFDPMANPDGRARFLAHFDSFSRRPAAVDRQDVLHNAFWPGGRGNHYLFDLNRDAIFGVQAESRARVAAILRASPQLFIDAHEMEAEDTFLFAVPAEPLNPHLPETVHDSWRDLARDHAAAFDAAGVSYYTRSWNEVFYPGFFDIWPAYHGAVPMLYEQSATSGASVRLSNGKLRSYSEAIDNQLRSAWANLATAARMHQELLLRWWRARASAARSGASPRAWIIPPTDASKSAAIVQLLHGQKIRIERLAAPMVARDLHSVWQRDARSVELPAGTLLVRSTQPLGALVRNIFDLNVPLPPAFVELERRSLELKGKTLLFDVTAWSLPLAYGVDVYWSDEVPAGEWTTFAPTTRVASSPQHALSSTAEYGFLYQDPSRAATARLLAQGLKVRTALEPFEQGAATWPRGTMLLRRDDQSASLEEALQSEAERGEVEFVGVGSARILNGPDLGGRELALLAAPRIAILTGAGVNAPGSGALWHLFESRMGLPVTLLEFSKLAAFDLISYNVIVIPDADDPRALGQAVKRGELDPLRHWTHTGGTLIAMAGSALALAEGELAACRPLRMQAGAERYEQTRRYLPRGAYFRIDLQPQHWLGFNVASRLPALFRETDSFSAVAGTDVVGRYADSATLGLAGLIWPEAVDYVGGSAYLLRERMGRGQLVLFANDPVFRGYSLGTERLLLNAAVLGPGMRTL